MLEAANKALDVLDKKVIAEIKGNNNPVDLVKFSLECLAILFDEKTDWENIKKVC